MRVQTKTLAWVVAALAASALLLAVLLWEHRYGRTRWTSFLVGDPHEGRHLFQEKGCAGCHAVNGVGSRQAPDLGFEASPQSSPSQLIAAIWNHIPRMWEGMEKERVPYPRVSDREMAHLLAYLYTARYVDEPGNPIRGEWLFESKGCRSCHAVQGAGGTSGPDLASVGSLHTPIAWTQAMWNHADAMGVAIDTTRGAWPVFQDKEMSDLLAYLRETCGGPRQEFKFLPADPERGWQLFQSKSCIACHSVGGEGGGVGSELGARREYPLTIVQFAGLMWNHFPEMWREMQARGITRPRFEGREMADLIAFLHNVRYFEPGGARQMGKVLFERRGCANCHGAEGEGTAVAPSLFNRSQPYTTVTFGVALWSHGPEMYARSRQLNLPWPTLLESDVGNLMVFLNTPAPENGPPETSR